MQKICDEIRVGHILDLFFVILNGSYWLLPKIYLQILYELEESPSIIDSLEKDDVKAFLYELSAFLTELGIFWITVVLTHCIIWPVFRLRRFRAGGGTLGGAVLDF